MIKACMAKKEKLMGAGVGETIQMATDNRKTHKSLPHANIGEAGLRLAFIKAIFRRYSMYLHEPLCF